MLFDFFFKPSSLQKLPAITDIHCHVVPGVDDGSPTAEKSVTLLSHMHDWGIERVFASPHSTQDKFENTPESLAEPFATLKSAVADAGLNIEMKLHMEYRIDNFFINQFERDNLICLPGNYLLIENAFSNEPWGMEHLLYNIRNKGYTPIIAHPERYQYYSQIHCNRYDELHEFGIYFQINLLSLAGYYGKLERETALLLLQKGYVQFIGTDIHRMAHVASIEHYLKSRQYKRDLRLLQNIQNDML